MRRMMQGLSVVDLSRGAAGQIATMLLADSGAEVTWFDDPDLVSQGWVTKYEHPLWGRTEQFGHLWNFSRTPARLFGPPVMHGQHSRQILSELGYTPAEIGEFAARGVTTLNPR